MKKLFPYPWYLSFWFWWLAGTAVYLVLSLHGGLTSTWENFGVALRYLTGLIGLFVPMGFFSFWFSLASWAGFITFPLLILALFLVDAAVYRFELTPWKKIFLNLMALFLLTLITDLILYRSWPSFIIFMSGGADFLRPAVL